MSKATVLEVSCQNCYSFALMNANFRILDSGAVTFPRGFLAGAVSAGIKVQEKLDLAILYSKEACISAGVFTTNAVKSAPVQVSRKHLWNKKAQAVVVNSGCANASTGVIGLADAEEMTNLAAKKLGLSPNDVFVASTGVIGMPLPMERIRGGIARIKLSEDGGNNFARAIMTTDTFPKEVAVLVESTPNSFAVAGAAKGAGMVHPNMATMLCFLTTDASVEAKFLQDALERAVNSSFNMVTIDGDTSPSDTVILLANGLANNKPFNKTNGEVFQLALNEACLYLAKCIALDGEGATKRIKVTVEGVLTNKEARIAARTIVGSMLVKSAIHGNDPNWGRIVAAIGRSGITIAEEKMDVYLNDTAVMKHGIPVYFDEQNVSRGLASKEVFIRVSLNLGKCMATAWGCDLSEEYVTINSEYTT